MKNLVFIIKHVSETIKNETQGHKGRFLGASLLGNLLADKGTIKADEGTIKAAEKTCSTRQDF